MASTSAAPSSASRRRDPPSVPPPASTRAQRLGVVPPRVFNEGYTATSRPRLERGEARLRGHPAGPKAHRLLPDDSEVTGLLALMLLTDARRPARTGRTGR